MVSIGRAGEGMAMCGETEGRAARPAWSKAHACCVDCGTTERPHLARGLCAACYARRYHIEHREERRDYHRRYAADDPARHRARVRSWRERNRERYLAWSRRDQRERYWRARGGEAGATQPTAPAPE